MYNPHVKARKRLLSVLLIVSLFLFADMILRKLSFTYACYRTRNLPGTTWWRINASYKDLSGYNFQKCVIAESDLIGVNLSHTKLTASRLRGSNLSHSALVSTSCQHVDFTNSILAYADLTGANLQYSKLKDTVLAGTNLSRANLTGAVLTNCRYDANTKWPAGFDPKAHGGIILKYPWKDIGPRY